MSLSCRLWHVKEAALGASFRWFTHSRWSNRHTLWLWILVFGLFGEPETIWAFVL